LQAIREVNALKEEQTKALITEDSDFTRFDLLIHAARQKKGERKIRMDDACRSASLRGSVAFNSIVLGALP
jgi:hypothetical protein